jgi:hypothetical protein
MGADLLLICKKMQKPNQSSEKKRRSSRFGLYLDRVRHHTAKAHGCRTKMGCAAADPFRLRTILERAVWSIKGSEKRQDAAFFFGFIFERAFGADAVVFFSARLRHALLSQ